MTDIRLVTADQADFARSVKRMTPSGTRIEGEVTPERLTKLTRHLKVNGQPFRSVIFEPKREAGET